MLTNWIIILILLLIAAIIYVFEVKGYSFGYIIFKRGSLFYKNDYKCGRITKKELTVKQVSLCSGAAGATNLRSSSFYVWTLLVWAPLYWFYSHIVNDSDKNYYKKFFCNYADKIFDYYEKGYNSVKHYKELISEYKNQALEEEVEHELSHEATETQKVNSITINNQEFNNYTTVINQYGHHVTVGQKAQDATSSETVKETKYTTNRIDFQKLYEYFIKNKVFMSTPDFETFKLRILNADFEPYRDGNAKITYIKSLILCVYRRYSIFDENIEATEKTRKWVEESCRTLGCKWENVQHGGNPGPENEVYNCLH